MAGFNVGRTQAQPTFLQGALVGLGGTLERMALDKLAQIQQQNEQRQFAQALQGLASPEGYQFSPQQAHLVSLLPIQQRLQALQTMSPGQAPAQAPFAPSFEQEPTLTSLGQQERAQELAPEQMPAYAPTEASALQFGQEINRLNTGQPLQFTAKDVLQQAKDLGYQITPDKVRQVQERVNQFNQNPQVQQQAFQDYQRAMQAQQAQGQAPQAAAPSVASAAPQPIFKKSLTQKEQLAEERALRKEILEEKKLGAKEQAKIDKDTQPYYNEASNAAKASYSSDNRLNRMEEIIKKGKLPMPGPRALVNGILRPFLGKDFDLSELGNPDAAEFKKLQNDFLRDAKNIFGSRLTNYDVETFLKIIPNLSISKEGNLRIIHELKLMNEAARIRKKEMDSIIKENGGKRPLNMDILVEDNIRPRLDEIAQRFKEGLPGQVSWLGF